MRRGVCHNPNPNFYPNPRRKKTTKFVEKTNEKHEILTETDAESISTSGTAAESQPQTRKRTNITATLQLVSTTLERIQADQDDS